MPCLYDVLGLQSVLKFLHIRHDPNSLAGLTFLERNKDMIYAGFLTFEIE